MCFLGFEASNRIAKYLLYKALCIFYSSLPDLVGILLLYLLTLQQWVFDLLRPYQILLIHLYHCSKENAFVISGNKLVMQIDFLLKFLGL